MMYRKILFLVAMFSAYGLHGAGAASASARHQVAGAALADSDQLTEAVRYVVEKAALCDRSVQEAVRHATDVLSKDVPTDQELSLMMAIATNGLVAVSLMPMACGDALRQNHACFDVQVRTTITNHLHRIEQQSSDVDRVFLAHAHGDMHVQFLKGSTQNAFRAIVIQALLARECMAAMP